MSLFLTFLSQIILSPIPQVVDGENVTTQCGTPGYIAPDILRNQPYGKPVDMWSFGVVLYILLGGYPPFHDDNQRHLFRKILDADYAFHPDYWYYNSYILYTIYYILYTITIYYILYTIYYILYTIYYMLL